jgi:hypothetical protein
VSKSDNLNDPGRPRSGLGRFLRRQWFQLNPVAEQRATRRGDIDPEELKEAMQRLERKGKLPKDPD